MILRRVDSHKGPRLGANHAYDTIVRQDRVHWERSTQCCHPE